MLAFTPGFAGSKRHHHSCSSSSSSSSSDSCETGVHKPKVINSSIIEFIVVDLYSDSTVPREDVIRAVKAVNEQVKKDFAPIWGVGAKFTVLPRGKIPHIKSNTQCIIYLADTFDHADLFTGSGAEHHIVQPPPNDFDGPQAQFFIPEVPLLPNGTPIILIPYGDPEGTYGLTLLLSLPQFSDFSLLDALGANLSHEVLETLGDVFCGFGFLGAYQILTPGPEQTFAYAIEVCDPVQDSYYSRRNVKVANFVTPDYFNPYPSFTTCLDFLGLVQEPFTPYSGVQFGYIINNCGDFESIAILSPIDNPTNLITFSDPVYSCSGDVVTNKQFYSKSRFAKFRTQILQSR